MFDLGMTELLVIGVVALIVIGPKDLPVVFRTVGNYVGKAKGMAREFSRAMNDAADDSGVRNMASDINKTLKTATNPVGSAMDGVKSAAAKLTDLDPESETAQLAADREERREKAKKIQAVSARAAAERKLQEAQDALAKAEELEAAVEPKVETPKSDT